MSEYWKDDADIRNDMCELSAFSTIPQPAPPPSEFMKKLRGKPSIFEHDPEEDEPEEEERYLPVRGHPLLKQAMRKPGGKPTFNHQETSALIREVAGLGYGNALIEHALKGTNSDEEKDPKRMKNLAFESSSLKNPISRKNDDESDSSTSTSSYISFSNIPDLNDKREFPDLK